MPMSTSTCSEVPQISEVANMRRTAFLSVLPDYYDTSRHHFSFIRFTTALEGVNARKLQRSSPAITSIASPRSWMRARSRPTGVSIPNHKKIVMLVCARTVEAHASTAHSNTHLTHLRAHFKATFSYPGLPLLSHESGQPQIFYAVEKFVSEFERTEPVYLQSRTRGRGLQDTSDVEELAERL